MKKLKTVKRVLNKGSYVTFIMAAKIAIVAFGILLAMYSGLYLLLIVFVILKLHMNSSLFSPFNALGIIAIIAPWNITNLNNREVEIVVHQGEKNNNVYSKLTSFIIKKFWLW